MLPSFSLPPDPIAVVSRSGCIRMRPQVVADLNPPRSENRQVYWRLPSIDAGSDKFWLIPRNVVIGRHVNGRKTTVSMHIPKPTRKKHNRFRIDDRSFRHCGPVRSFLRISSPAGSFHRAGANGRPELRVDSSFDKPRNIF